MSSTPEERVLTLARQGRPTVGKILSELKDQYSAEELLGTLDSLEKEGRLELRQVIPRSHNLPKYVADAKFSLWFQVVLLATAAINALVYITPQIQPFLTLRVAVGFIFILFLPGFAAVEALFPNQSHLERHERIALSIGLSLAVTILIGLALNYSPMGIRLSPVLSSLSIFVVIVSTVGLLRKYRLALREYSPGSSESRRQY